MFHFPVMARTFLLLSLLALVLTKAADVVTTLRGIRRCGIAGERNPLARRAMERWGIGGGIAAIMFLWVLVVLLTYVPAWYSPAWTQWAVAGMGFFIAWAQWDVARCNATQRHSWFTRLMVRRYDRARRRRGRSG